MNLKMITQVLRSDVPGHVPVPDQLLEGQLAINFADGLIFSKDSEGNIHQLGGNKNGTFDIPLTAPSMVLTGVLQGNNANFSGEVWGNSFNINSLAACKTDIEPFVESALELIKNLDIKKFFYVDDEEKINKKVGIIADNTHPLVSGVNQDHLDVNNAIGLLFKAVQELASKFSS
jgi:hypothetical protein